MRNLLLVALSVFVSLTFSSAQEGNSHASKNMDHSSVQGCVNSGSGNGGYTLTSKSGQTYELVGNETLLSKFVGKEVKITGSKGSATDLSTGMSGNTGEATSNPSAGTAPSIKVSSVTLLSDHCGK